MSQRSSIYESVPDTERERRSLSSVAVAPPSRTPPLRSGTAIRKIVDIDHRLPDSLASLRVQLELHYAAVDFNDPYHNDLQEMKITFRLDSYEKLNIICLIIEGVGLSPIVTPIDRNTHSELLNRVIGNDGRDINVSINRQLYCYIVPGGKPLFLNRQSSCAGFIYAVWLILLYYSIICIFYITSNI